MKITINSHIVLELTPKELRKFVELVYLGVNAQYDIEMNHMAKAMLEALQGDK